ncbi:MAG TPA: hypothetical protein PKD10_17890, partial [Paracoccaceae bacterium]|nr:hypothetical protein [Paracoccaceae bacterium]
MRRSVTARAAPAAGRQGRRAPAVPSVVRLSYAGVPAPVILPADGVVQAALTGVVHGWPCAAA